MDHRVLVTKDDIQSALEALKEALRGRMQQKGSMSFIGLLEVDGSLDQEIREFKEAVHDKDEQHACDELLDVAVGAVFGWASVRANRRERLK